MTTTDSPAKIWEAPMIFERPGGFLMRNGANDRESNHFVARIFNAVQ
jgi:hypothetical protein